jgi:hypothetical protein
MNRTTLGKSRVRESRTLGSVGAKLNGLATRPSPEWKPLSYLASAARSAARAPLSMLVIA